MFNSHPEKTRVHLPCLVLGLVLSLASLVNPAQSQESNSRASERGDSSIPSEALGVSLNHIYVVLDDETFKSFQTSEFFNQRFAKSDSGLPDFRHVTPDDQAMYVRGQHTYLELLGPKNKFKEPVGKVGLGFSVEQPGAINQVESHLRRSHSEVNRALLKWDLNTTEAVNWFEVVSLPQKENARLVWWVSEYHPDFLPALYPNKPTDETGIRRDQFLAPHYAPDRLFRDLKTITLKLSDENANRLAQSLVALGFSETADKFHRSLALNDIQIRIVSHDGNDPTDSPLLEVGFTANDVGSMACRLIDVENVRIQFSFDDHGTLEFDNSIAESRLSQSDDWKTFPAAKPIVRHPEAVPREECFPIETLPEELQTFSKQLLLDALDSEALYTMVGGLKPVSEGFHNTWLKVEPLDDHDIVKARQAIAVWKCGDELEAGVLVFQHLRDGERFASAWIANKTALAAKLTEKDEFFRSIGLSQSGSAEAILLRIEGASLSSERWRGFGYLFGYPDHAVDFFVKSGEHMATTGEFVERDFRNFPTHLRETGRFVYAVPKLQSETPQEIVLRSKVENILASYRCYRRRFINDDDADLVVELIREWFDDGNGWCHPTHALQKAQAMRVERTLEELHTER